MAERDEALERFCAQAYPQLVAALTHHCGDVHLAEEFAQEALVVACRRWSTVQAYDAPVGWCYRVGVNLANSWYRRRRVERRVRERADREAPASYRDPDSADAVAVRQALRSLTDAQREAIILRYFLDLSVEQTAAVLGASPGAVRGLTHRAVKALRDVLDVDADNDAREATDVS